MYGDAAARAGGIAVQDRSVLLPGSNWNLGRVVPRGGIVVEVSGDHEFNGATHSSHHVTNARLTITDRYG
jgi:hypothetical protein